MPRSRTWPWQQGPSGLGLACMLAAALAAGACKTGPDSRQIPFDPEKGVISIAEQQGALGGLTRAANAAHQENT